MQSNITARARQGSQLSPAQLEILRRLPTDLSDALAAGTAEVVGFDPREVADVLQTFVAPCNNALRPTRTRRRRRTPRASRPTVTTGNAGPPAPGEPVPIATILREVLRELGIEYPEPPRIVDALVVDAESWKRGAA